MPAAYPSAESRVAAEAGGGNLEQPIKAVSDPCMLGGRSPHADTLKGVKAILDQPCLQSDYPTAVAVLNKVPVFDFVGCSGDSNNDVEKREQIFADAARALRMEGPGVAVARNVFTENEMEALAEWCREYWVKQEDEAKKNAGAKKVQKDHFAAGSNRRVWQVPEKLPADLLISLTANEKMNGLVDSFLGKYHIGSYAVNEVAPGGPAQLLHTDYPPGFYTKEELRDTFSKHALQHIYPYFSLQAGVAVSAMDSSNGATEVVPFSHQVEDNDWQVLAAKDVATGKLSVGDAVFAGQGGGRTVSWGEWSHREEGWDWVLRALESIRAEGDNPLADRKYIVQNRLERGDVLLFNRKLLHRGGENTSDTPRTALLLQAIMPFGVKMEQLDSKGVVGKLARYLKEVNLGESADKFFGDKQASSSASETANSKRNLQLAKSYAANGRAWRTLKYRFTGPNFPRDIENANPEEDNN